MAITKFDQVILISPDIKLIIKPPHTLCLYIYRQKHFQGSKRRRNNIITDLKLKYVLEFGILYSKVVFKISCDIHSKDIFPTFF